MSELEFQKVERLLSQRIALLPGVSRIHCTREKKKGAPSGISPDDLITYEKKEVLKVEVEFYQHQNPSAHDTPLQEVRRSIQKVKEEVGSACEIVLNPTMPPPCHFIDIAP